MKTIWKFELEVTYKQVIRMPAEAEVLSVQTQHDQPVLWALVGPKHYLEERTFFMHGTGHSVGPEVGRFVGTFQMAEGGLVFHLFEG